MERECERRRGGQSPTQMQRTKAVAEEDGKDVKWRTREEQARSVWRVKRCGWK